MILASSETVDNRYGVSWRMLDSDRLVFRPMLFLQHDVGGVLTCGDLSLVEDLC